MSWYNIPVKRPVATAMFFCAIMFLGLVGWQRIPVELIPDLEGDSIRIDFGRLNSEPEVVEREILIPLEEKASLLPDLKETFGSISGSNGSLEINFEPGTDIKVRQLELQRIAAELNREQPRGSYINVGGQDFSMISRIVMSIQVIGGEDTDSLRNFVEENIQSRIAAVEGVANVFVMGGAPEEITVRVDSDKCSALGISPQGVSEALTRSVQRLKFLGGLEDASTRTPVILDGRPKGVYELGELRITPDRSILIRHVAEVTKGTGRKENIYRVNSKPSVALAVFKEEGANLVELGKEIQVRLTELKTEFKPYGIDFITGFDAAKTVEKQIDRLKQLAFSGFIISLMILFLFIKRLRAVTVVAIAVPVSLLSSMAFLYTGGFTLNLVTLVGLAVGVGMLVDNSIVVYEAVQRRLERGVDPDRASGDGVRITFKAILASTITNAIVFLPVFFIVEDSMMRGVMKLLATSILIPLGASLLVALGLVPLLTRKFAARAAMERITAVKKRRELFAGLHFPDRWRDMFTGLLKNSMRHPATWITVITAVVLFTSITGVSWILSGGGNRGIQEADEIQFSIDVPAGDSLESISQDMNSLEQVALKIEGVESVESMIQEKNSTLTVRFVEKDMRPPELTAPFVRNKISKASEKLKGFHVRAENSAGQGGGGGRQSQGSNSSIMGQSPAEVVISGPDSGKLIDIAGVLKERLASIPEIDKNSIRISSRPGQDEVHIIPDDKILNSLGLFSDQVFIMMSLVLSREGTQMNAGTIEADGKEIPIVIRSNVTDTDNLSQRMEDLRINTSAGVITLGYISDARKMPPPNVIEHHNGRREMAVYYSLDSNAPSIGPAREALDEDILNMIKTVPVPEGYVINPSENNETTSMIKRILIPMVLLLFAVLAITFESLTMPVLVLLSAPLTIIGAVWALVFAGMPLTSPMAIAGVIVLMGLMVNPAILLVDRMQARVLGSGWSSGAAALAAVKERSRPVLMTTVTTIAGLWPLAISTGAENEMWPPFAVVIIGGLITSGLLILLVIPIGFVFLSRLDRIFGRIGPWITVAWICATGLFMSPLIYFEQITTLTWQVTTTLLVALVLLGMFVLIFRKFELPQPSPGVEVEVKYIHKIYGRPGPVTKALRAAELFAEKVLARGGKPFLPSDVIPSMITGLVLLAGVSYLAFSLSTIFWRVVFSFVGAVILIWLLTLVRKFRGKCDAKGNALPGGVENMFAMLVPWVVFCLNGLFYYLAPVSVGKQPRLALFPIVLIAVIIVFIQAGRKTAKDLASGRMIGKYDAGFIYRTKLIWRELCRVLFGLDLPRDIHGALKNINFRAEKGMIGILGPNGAGKTTLLRAIAGILEPTAGVITLGGVPIKKIRRYLANWVGYLPQDFGLPKNLTGREYLEYYALLYRIDEKDKIIERVNFLLAEVGLSEQADKKIGDYSGGMRQRVAVARTLLRLPPVIIVDEPTVGLDPKERIRFRNLLSRLAETRIVLFSTHVVEDVAVACERVIVLSKGRKVFDGEPGLLASVANGKTWEMRIREGEEDNLPENAIVVDQVPEADGFYNIRVLYKESPGPDAKEATPNLQDGYLELVGTRRKRIV
jgi:multidrug efflux pump subunit AcrB/ABC-type multidrug transport system ATPase subunit